jgi:hypothetical protein
VASNEALDVRYWAMCHALYHRIRMAIKVASDLSAFLLPLVSLLATTIAKDHVMVYIN